jgi:hypothetical protein
MPAAYEIRAGGDVKNKKQSMADLKLRRLNELNMRLKEDLERPRIKVSEAAMRYVLPYSDSVMHGLGILLTCPKFDPILQLHQGFYGAFAMGSGKLDQPPPPHNCTSLDDTDYVRYNRSTDGRILTHPSSSPAAARLCDLSARYPRV